MNKNEKTAIDVKKECADVYYSHLSELPKELKSRISCYMLDNIFKLMVVPAIDKARALDREGCKANEEK